MSSYNISTRYANAFMEFVEGKNSLEQASDDMIMLENTLSESKELNVVLKSPVINKDKKESIIKEIFAKKVRDKICPEKISGERWLEIIERVHVAGLKSNATMLFGHLESYADRIDHLSRLRDLQDETGGFQAFIPLAFQPDNTRVPGAKGVSGIDALKTLAISRLYLDNFQHIKAYWVMLGLKIAQVSLAFGVNDLDGTVVEEQIGHDAGAESPQALSLDQLTGLIRKAGRTPVERNTLYEELRSY